ncbi:hypothetical protein [Aedoeadaptatus nemausensis]|nr:hypothetical protein [Peptoniphilus nemausensis]
MLLSASYADPQLIVIFSPPFTSSGTEMDDGVPGDRFVCAPD